ncbi:putative RNA-directed DNA polymerase from transposon X-element [Trichonephila clavipes]|nr:putative RNA-directed DNA polymerase from transposon X-element [Trichonephila clavipes]
MYSSSPIGLSLCSSNANDLLRRDAELRIFIEKHSPDIFLIQETHLRPSHNFNIANYTCHRNDRISDGPRTAGGTLILVKNSLKHYCLPTPPLRALEATNTVMRPILAYASPVWGYAAKTNINILDTLQNSLIRMIVKATRYMRNDDILNGVTGPTELLRVGGRRMFRCSGEMGRRAVPFPTLPGVSGVE